MHRAAWLHRIASLEEEEEGEEEERSCRFRGKSLIPQYLTLGNESGAEVARDASSVGTDFRFNVHARIAHRTLLAGEAETRSHVIGTSNFRRSKVPLRSWIYMWIVILCFMQLVIINFSFLNHE